MNQSQLKFTLGNQQAWMRRMDLYSKAPRETKLVLLLLIAMGCFKC